MGEPAFVLIVENEPEHAETLAAGLREQGHACRVVTSLEDALESVRTRRPDVIIADAEMAGSSNGARLIRESNRLAPETEIVLMSSDGESAALIAGRAGEQLRNFNSTHPGSRNMSAAFRR